MNISYQIFYKEKLVIQKFVGDFDFKEYMNYAQSVMQKIDPKTINKVIIDIREINYNDVPDDFIEGIEKMIKIRKDITEEKIKRNDITHIFWVDKPMPTVISQIFIQNMPDLKYHYCSTKKKVLDQLGLKESFDDLDIIIEHLENNFEH